MLAAAALGGVTGFIFTDEIDHSRSISNPFIFKNLDLEYIDPGTDRMASVPV